MFGTKIKRIHVVGGGKREPSEVYFRVDKERLGWETYKEGVIKGETATF